MAIRNTCVFSIKLIKSLNLNRIVLSNYNDRTSFYLTMASQRMISSFVITPNLKLKTVSPINLETKVDTLSILKTNVSRPLVVLLEYLKAKERHVKKYVDIYVDYGFDVLQVHLKPWQLLWPTKGSQIVAKDVAQFLAINKSYTPVVVHGFSVGGYLWGEVLVHFSKNLDFYQPVADRIKCQIFDSAADIDGVPTGIPGALFPKNPILRSALEKYVRYHLKTFYEESTKHYERSRKEFSSGLIKSPTLMITSDADPLSTLMHNEKVRQELAVLNLECYIKVFKGSTHVAHFRKYRDEYIAEIESFFAKVNLIQPQKIKAKL